MSGASTMRNAVKRITHKERAQPSNRKRFGLLEKHKDYVERAQDYKKKQKNISSLRRKAEGRNPDEFYFKMNNSQVRHGVHRDNKSANNPGGTLDPGMVRLLKTQDMGYIAMKKAIDDSKIRKLKSSLHNIGKKTVKSHKIFVTSSKAVESFDLAEHFNTEPELVDRAFNRTKRPSVGKIDQLDSDSDENDEARDASARPIGASSSSSRKRNLSAIGSSSSSSSSVSGVDSANNGGAEHTKPKAYKELKERIRRAKQLKVAMEQLALQRSLTHSKGSRRKIVLADDGSIIDQRNGAHDSNNDDGDSGSAKQKVIYKWKRQRQR